MRATALIEVPYMCGDAAHPARHGPARCAEALGAHGPSTTVGSETGVGTDPVSASLRVNRELASAVRTARARGERPLVLAGSCDASLGVLAGVADAGCGIVWLDAHADFNTPDSSASGFFPGMALAVVTGHCHREEWAAIGGRPVPEEATALVGVRDVSPAAEQDRLDGSALHVVPWRAGQPTGDVAAALDAVAARAQAVYVHVDLDGLDPSVAPGIVDEPVPGGLTAEQAEGVLDGVRARFEVAAATIATYVPDRDADDRTLEIATRLAELLIAP